VSEALQVQSAVESSFAGLKKSSLQVFVESETTLSQSLTDAESLPAQNVVQVVNRQLGITDFVPDPGVSGFVPDPGGSSTPHVQSSAASEALQVQSAVESSPDRPQFGVPYFAPDPEASDFVPDPGVSVFVPDPGDSGFVPDSGVSDFVPDPGGPDSGPCFRAFEFAFDPEISVVFSAATLPRLFAGIVVMVLSKSFDFVWIVDMTKGSYVDFWDCVVGWFAVIPPRPPDTAGFPSEHFTDYFLVIF
jgi:hypothetical protein